MKNTPNVTGFVGSHGNRSKPTPLLEQEIRDILVSMGQTVQEFDFDVGVGQTVRIIDGALQIIPVRLRRLTIKEDDYSMFAMTQLQK